MNEEYRFLFGESDKDLNEIQYRADTQLDLNYIVDSLEDEHTRRIVHTTKALECEDEKEEEAKELEK